MKIVLKNIKHVEFASHETDCYEASLYIDGKRIGVVSNDGQGGCDNFHGDRKAYHAANEWCQANLPKVDGFQTDIEDVCSKLLNDHLNYQHTKRQLQKTMKSEFLMVDHVKEQLVSVKALRAINADTITMAKQRWPDHTVLNGMPIKEAVEKARAVL